jgi:hypothetical protein
VSSATVIRGANLGRSTREELPRPAPELVTGLVLPETLVHFDADADADAEATAPLVAESTLQSSLDFTHTLADPEPLVLPDPQRRVCLSRVFLLTVGR